MVRKAEKKILPIILFLLLSQLPLAAQLVYTAECSIDLGYGISYGGYYWQGDQGSLAGTLTYDDSDTEPDALEFDFDSTSTLTFVKSNGKTKTVTIDAYCIVTDSTNDVLFEITGSGTYETNRLDTKFPLKFYLFYDPTELDQASGHHKWTLVSVSSQILFNPVDEDGNPIETVSNMGTGTLSIPLLGGGLVGPAGINSLPASYFGDDIETGDLPDYSMGFTETDVHIDDLTDAIGNLLEVSDLLLTVENFDDVYLGETEVTVKFYQDGYPSFRFLGPGSAIIPFTLHIDGEEIQPYMPCSPWDAPLAEENLVPVAISVTQTDYDSAVEGDYTATITVEMLCGS
jgi:hypothetical protein